MLNPGRAELESTYNNAVAAAELLRQSGEVAKAARVESLARIIARELGLNDLAAVMRDVTRDQS